MPNSTSVAIFSIDPGGTSGCARALIDLRRITVAKAMQRAVAKGNVETWCEKGPTVEQAWSITLKIDDFLFNTIVERALVYPDNFLVVCEGFEVRQMNADLSSIYVKAGIETLMHRAFKTHVGRDGFYQVQSASEAKGFCTDDMLDRWSLLKGRTPHERDALRHIARRVDKLL